MSPGEILASGQIANALNEPIPRRTAQEPIQAESSVLNLFPQDAASTQQPESPHTRKYFHHSIMVRNPPTQRFPPYSLMEPTPGTPAETPEPPHSSAPARE